MLASNSSKILGFEDYETIYIYIKKRKVDFFRKSLYLSNSRDEYDIITESCYKDERAHMAPNDNLDSDFFYTYLLIIQYLRVLIPFTMFEYEVLKTISVTHSQILPNGWAFIRAFEILCRNLVVSHTMGIFFSFYNTKTTSKGSWITLGPLFTRVLITLIRIIIKI